MAGFFDYSSTPPRRIAALLLAVGGIFLLLGVPLVAYGAALPSTFENEMLPFIMLLCGVLVTASGLAMLVIAVKLRRRFPAA